MKHPVGIVIVSKAQIGTNCQIYQNVTIGRRESDDYPIIGDNVFIGPGSIILGSITIGNNAIIAAGATVLNDVEADSTCITKRTVSSRRNKSSLLNNQNHHLKIGLKIG